MAEIKISRLEPFPSENPSGWVVGFTVKIDETNNFYDVTTVSYEEANFIRETFIDKYQLRELQLIPEQIDRAQQPLVQVQKFDSVDQIVLKQLEGVDSETYDKSILMAIYNNLDVNN